MALYVVETSADKYLMYTLKNGAEILVLTTDRVDANKVLAVAIKSFPAAKIVEVGVTKV